MNPDIIYEQPQELIKVWPIWPTNSLMLAEISLPAPTLFHHGQITFC